MMPAEKAYKLTTTIIFNMVGRPIKISGIKYTIEIRSNDMEITEIKNRSTLERNFIICSSPYVLFFDFQHVDLHVWNVQIGSPMKTKEYKNKPEFNLIASIECTILLVYHYHPILSRDSKVFYQKATSLLIEILCEGMLLLLRGSRYTLICQAYFLWIKL
jgi:hypothetical protein